MNRTGMSFIGVLALMLLTLQVGIEPTAEPLVQGGMRYECTQPCPDFAVTADTDGKIIGTLSMLDGNQVAYIDAGGNLVAGKGGRFRYSSKSADGLYMNFVFERKDARLPNNGGIRFDSLTFEYKFDGKGPDAKQYVFVLDITPHGSSFEYATKKSGQESFDVTRTIYETLEVCKGHLYLLVRDLPEAGTNKLFRGVLYQPFSGLIQLVTKPEQSLDCKKITSNH